MQTCPAPIPALAGQTGAARTGRRARGSIFFLFLFLIPLLLLGLLSLTRFLKSSPVRATSQAGDPPPIVRQHLEGVMKGEVDIPGSPLVLWRASATHTDNSPVWFAEKHRTASGDVRAMCEEATGELILFSRDHLPVSESGEGRRVVREESDVTQSGRRCLALLGKADPSSWTLTAHPPTKAQQAIGETTWLVQGRRGDTTFQMRIDPATDTVLFYLQGKKDAHPPVIP